MSFIEKREAYFYREFQVCLCPENKDLTGIIVGKHMLVFPIVMAEALAVHMLRVTQLQRECADTGDYSNLQQKVEAIKPNPDEIIRQSRAYNEAKANGNLRED